MKALFLGIYDRNTISLAPFLLSQCVGGDFEQLSIFDDTPESIAKMINERKPDFVCFSAYIWNAKIIKDTLPKIEQGFKIVGGPHALDNDFLDHGADAVVIGEGEEILKKIFEERSPGTHHGLLTDLATLPLLYNKLSNIDDYEWLPVETSRGCPMRCGYCAWASSHKMRFYDLDHVFDELDFVLSSKINWVYLCDSSLLFNKERGRKILKFCSKYKKAIRFEFAIGQLDKDIIDALLEMPESEYNFGVQTINPPALNAISRAFNKEIFEREYNALSANHNVTVDAIYGLPEDNIEGYKRTLDYMSSLPNIKRILTNPLILLPGSPYWQQKEKWGFVYDPETYLLIRSNHWSEKDMQEARDYSFKIVKGKEVENAPDLIPTTKEGFEKRNRFAKSVNVEGRNVWAGTN